MFECKLCLKTFERLRDLTFHNTQVHQIRSKDYKKSLDYIENLKIEMKRLILKNNSCWIWTGSSFPDGYGRYGNERAHRLSYKLFKGNLQKGKLVCHTCDTPLCINPDHLYLGSPQDNMNDMKNRNRSLKGNLNPSTREEVKQKLRKKWLIKTPDNKEVITNNLMEFCKKNKLNYRTMSETRKSGRYTCQRI